MRRFKSLKVGIVGLSVIAMMLQLIMSSAHIHGLDGDIHQKLSDAGASSTRFPSQHAPYSALSHAGHDHANDHHNHHDHRHGPPPGHIDYVSNFQDDPARHSHSDTDDEHSPWHDCDICLVFGAFASVDAPETTDIAPSDSTQAKLRTIRQSTIVNVVRLGANGARAPPVLST